MTTISPGHTYAAKGTNPFRSSFFLWAIVLIIFFGVLVSQVGAHFGTLVLKNGDLFIPVLERLGALVVLALFVERLVEVYVIGFREQGQIAAKAEVEAAEAMVAEAQLKLAGAAPGPDFGLLLNQLEQARHQKGEVEKTTKKQALVVSLVIGTMVGLCGVSILGVFLVNPKTMPVPIRVVDIIMVGALIAGGANPLHDMMETLKNGLERAKENSQSNSTPAGTAPAPSGQQ